MGWGCGLGCGVVGCVVWMGLGWCRPVGLDLHDSPPRLPRWPPSHQMQPSGKTKAPCNVN